MPRSLPPLNAIRAFEAAGRHQSFSLAAQELGVTHSSISRHVRGLEGRLGLQLFRDAARGVVLSPEGRSFLAQISPAMDAISEATEGLANRTPGVITISCEPGFATEWLMPRLPDFLDKNPSIEPRITATKMVADLERFEADIAIRSVIRTDVPDDADLISRAPMLPFAAPDSPATQIADVHQLLDLPRYRDRQGDPWGAWLTAAGVDPAVIPPAGWRLTYDLALPLVLAGHGVLLATPDLLQRYIEAGRLVCVWDAPLYQGAYYLMIEHRARRRKAVRQFRHWLLSASAELRVNP